MIPCTETYPTELIAKQHRPKALRKRQTRCYHTYFCPACQGWHLISDRTLKFAIRQQNIDQP